ncbi:MAG: hypothetical protein J7L46_00100, partial [Bacteroidales bacterium]|nr:hypothetical protein [Bacteroidales bacterium]
PRIENITYGIREHFFLNSCGQVLYQIVDLKTDERKISVKLLFVIISCLSFEIKELFIFGHKETKFIRL